MKIKTFFVLSLCFSVFSPYVRAGEIVARIQRDGFVRCGARTVPKAFAWQTETKEWAGIDVEACRAVAAAVLGRPDAIRVVAVNKEDGFPKLANGEIDMLMASVPWTLRTETLYGAMFPATYYYSALGFLGHAVSEASSMEAYKDKKVCVDASSFLTSSLEAYNKRYGLGLRLLKMPDIARAKEFFYMQRCDLLFDRIEVLKSDYFRTSPAGVSVLPEVVYTYPTGPFVSGRDKEFFEIVRWTIYGLVAAERKGITVQNVEDFVNTDDAEINELLGEQATVSKKLGIPPKFLWRVISSVGNYGDIYERSFGKKAAVDLPRGVNKLKENGGRMDAPSFQN